MVKSTHLNSPVKSCPRLMWGGLMVVGGVSRWDNNWKLSSIYNLLSS
jgi:hypothetical protein